MLVEAAVTINRRDFDAAIFDVDSVLTDTAGVHAAAWKTVFDAFLQRWAEQHGRAFQPFESLHPVEAVVSPFLLTRGKNGLR